MRSFYINHLNSSVVHGNKSTVVFYLGNALKNPDKNVRVAAASALGDISTPTKEAIRYL